ncbi:MAG: hypothetical protein U0V02_14335 [Anaerolineales bacterium]
MDVVINTLVYLSNGIPGLVISGLSIIFAFLALIRKDESMMVMAALFAFPVTYVAGAWVGILLVVRLMPLFLLLSAFFISRHEPVFAWILPVPTLGYLIYFVFRLVATNFGG